MRISPTGELYIDELFVTREVANAVPAYRRAKTLIGSNLSILPLRQRDGSGKLLPSIPILRRPDPDRVSSAFWSDLYADLADFGVAYAVNPNWSNPSGWRYADSQLTARKHASLRYLPVEDVLDVSETHYRIRTRTPGADHYDEELVPVSAVVGFECSAGNWLKTGARAITTARLLEDAARMYANYPQPLSLLRNTGPRKTPEQVQELLATMESARRTRSTAYLGRDLDLTSTGFTATDISLSDARGTAVLDIARVTGVPSLYLFQGPNDASMTYSNMTMMRLDLHAAMVPFAQAVAERFSFDDLTGNGVTVEHDFSPFLRVDPQMRADLYASLISSGVMTVEEARQLEGFVATEGTPL
jgi:hypothetical protein